MQKTVCEMTELELAQATAQCYQVINSYQQTLNAVLMEVKRRSEIKEDEPQDDELQGA